MAVALVVELARLAVAIRPDRGAIEHLCDLNRVLPRLYRRLVGGADDAGMNRYLALVLLALALPATALGGSAQTGSWKPLAAAPITPDFDARTSVWSGKEMIVFGRDQLTALDANTPVRSAPNVPPAPCTPKASRESS